MKAALLILFFLPLLVTAQIGNKLQQGKIHGIWKNSQFGYQMTLMLNPDGSGEFDGEMIKFTSEGTKLSIIDRGQTTVYTFILQGNSLTLSGGDLEKAITFTRGGTAEQVTQQSPAIITHPTTRKVNDGNVGDLIGVWSGNGETIEFKSNAQCIYLGNTFPYEVSQGHVILTTGQVKVMFAYSIQGNQLNLTANGRLVSYTRGTTVSGVSANRNTGGGNGAQELVGKWCYMNNSLNSSTNRCITLNADGTYSYNSENSRTVNTAELYGGTASQGGDQGTWYVQGDRIYYNSQTQGQGSYRLEKRNHPKNSGDPMIVLDGEAYVTATLKAPWR